MLRRHLRPQREKTEVIESVVDGQQSLFSDDELAQLQDSNVSITEVIEKQKKQVVRHRKAKVSGQRTAFLDRLPQVDKTIHLTNEDCPKCHEQMKKIGNHLYSREVRLKPAELYCVNLYQESYKCNDCDEDGKDIIISHLWPRNDESIADKMEGNIVFKKAKENRLAFNGNQHLHSTK